MFSGIPREMIDFFLALRFNNNRDFFEQNRERYERFVKEPLQALAQAMGPTLAGIDPQFDVRPARVVSRIRRDTRFSHNKDPYRDHMWLSWRYAGQATADAMGFYWDVSPEATHWGFGYYAENKQTMDRVRRRIIAKPQEILDLLAHCGIPERFALQGDAYKRLAVPPEVPEALRDLYVKKGFYFQNTTGAQDFDALFSGAIVQNLQKDFERVAPLYDWMRGRQLDEIET
ncbi:MAG: DUF2461 domain-containing protein [Clostridia bacterium]|nr:DUF2461 domain-containing protein [Clostridia bacterium]